MALDLSYDMTPLFNMLLSLVVWMVAPGLVVAILTKRLPTPLFRLLTMGAILGGAYGYFKYGM